MIDREIRDALNVDPSPEFLARVRTRVANEPLPSAWRWSWGFAAVGALAAAVVVAIALTPQRKPEAARTIPDVAQGFSPAIAPRNPNPSAGAVAPPVVSGFSRTASPREPDVLVNAGEMHALQGLIAGARNGNVTFTPLTAAAPPAPMELEPVTDIVIAPITIDPITPQAGVEGERP